MNDPYRNAGDCHHGITFDEAEACEKDMSPAEVRQRWPRLAGPCKMGCSYNGIYYASMAHFVYGDW